MTDPMSGPAPHCPWCSAALPEPGAERCPSCDAQLVSARGTDADIKGVTTLDAEAILRARSAVARPRSRFLSLITGDEADAASAREHQTSLAQPSNEVRREMDRLEAEARHAAIEAERVALQAEAMSQLGIHVDDLPAAEAAHLAGHDAAAGSAAADDNPGEAADAAVAPPDAATPDDAGTHDAAEAPQDAEVPDAAGLDTTAEDDRVAVEGDWPAELHVPDEPPA